VKINQNENQNVTMTMTITISITWSFDINYLTGHFLMFTKYHFHGDSQIELVPFLL